MSVHREAQLGRCGQGCGYRGMTREMWLLAWLCVDVKGLEKKVGCGSEKR